MGLADLLVPLLFLGVAGDPLTIYTLPSSSAVLGSAALLKCRFNIGGPINLTTLQVRWYFSDRSVAQYDRGKETFAPGVSISQQELLIGNASLGMENVRVSDEGQYRCVVGYGAERQQSETTLLVFAAPRLSILRRSARRDAANSFPCHVRGFYPGDVTVAWLRDGRVLADTTRSAPKRNPDGTFNLTLTYTFTPTASDSGSLFSCRVSHAALAQPLQEGFPLAVTVPRAGADHTSAAIGATLGILVAGGAAAALAIYCRRKRREGPYSAVEMPPEDPAGSRDKTRGEDTVLMANDGVRDAGKGPEQQPLLPAQGQDQSEIQEQEDGAQVTASSSSSGSKASDVGPRASSWITQGGPEAEGPSLNPEPLGETGAPDEERAGAASPRTQPAVEVAFPAQHSAAGEEGETALNQHSGEAMVPTSQPKAGDQGAPGSQTNEKDQGVPDNQTKAAANTVSDPAQEEDAQGEAGVPQAPVLYEISPSEALAPGKQVTLSCQIARFYPKALSVTWYRQKRGEPVFRCLDTLGTHKIVTPDPTAAPDGKSYSVTSQLGFTPSVPEDHGAEYLCSVEHQTLQEPEGKSTGPLELRARPQVSGIQVLPHWEPREEVPFAVQIQNFYPREIHRIQWSWDRAGSGRDETPEISQNPDLTFSATSVWRIPSRGLNRPELRVRVSVQQSPREPPIEREIRARDTGLLRPPEVSEISQPESVTAGEEITLSCRMAGHFPGVLCVTWLRRNTGAGATVRILNSAEYSIEPGAPHTQDGKSFQQETRLRFTPLVQRDQGAEYVCRVGHVILLTPVERRSRELQVTE
ncbi:uncharacterized protein LOC119566245 [Chelonia mydas]|uniref:uncharacterized protein LOC119566245 n=1 Tax=Chelonia mydas TaxID=8469 RepID=UPI001CA928CA|nr:uncharacterized protein LOC119566245 [Chelonia mydas]